VVAEPICFQQQCEQLKRELVPGFAAVCRRKNRLPIAHNAARSLAHAAKA
jgi:hypothetical protein